jgi:hypothetical protein
MFKKVFAAALIAVAGATLCAAPWANLGPKRVPETLILVSNYKTPRLMAELIQFESRAPYILLPVNGSNDNRIFFCPAKKTSHQIREVRFNAFIRFLNPKRIVAIGNDQVINKRYIDMLDRSIPIVRIDSSDWQRIAEELNFLLNLSHLDTNFKRLHDEMLKESSIYRPVSLPEQKKPAANSVPGAENSAAKTEQAAPAAAL